MLGAALAVVGAALIIGTVLIVGALWYHGGLVALVAGMAAAGFGAIKLAFLASGSGRHRP